MEGAESEFANFTLPTLKKFLEARSHNVSDSCYMMPQNALFSYVIVIFYSAWKKNEKKKKKKTTQRYFFSTLHPLSKVIFATATVLAFVLLHDSRFNFHCYTQREATPTQKSARKCAAISRDFLRERLQSAFTLANQLR